MNSKSKGSAMRKEVQHSDTTEPTDTSTEAPVGLAPGDTATYEDFERASSFLRKDAFRCDGKDE